MSRRVRDLAVSGLFASIWSTTCSESTRSLECRRPRWMTCSACRPQPNFREYDYVYWLGPERGAISIDSEWSVLKLDTGSVVQAEHVTD